MGKSHAAAVSAEVSDNATRTVHWAGSARLKLQTNTYERCAVGSRCDGECVSSKQSQILERAKTKGCWSSRIIIPRGQVFKS